MEYQPLRGIGQLTLVSSISMASMAQITALIYP